MCGFVDDLFDFVGDAFAGLGKGLEGVLQGDLGSIMNLAALIPGPQQPFVLGANALRNLSDDNPLGAALSAAGAAGAGGMFGDTGGLSGTSGSFSPGSTALGSVDDLSGAWSTIGTGSDSLGDFLSTLPSGRLEGSGISGGSTGLGNLFDSIGMAPAVDAMTARNLPQMVSGVRGSPLMGALGGGLKLYGGIQDYMAARDARKAYRNNVAELRNLFSPDSAYAQQARKRIERRDAARGRNSQYGSREVELAALLADRQAQVLSSPQYGAQLGASEMSSAGLGSLLGGIGSFAGGLRGLF